MAKTPNSTPTPSGPPQGALPSITELGRMLGEIARREAGIDLVPIGRGEPADAQQRSAWAQDDRRLMTADHLMVEQMDALHGLIAALPARTLSDAVVQVNVAGHMISKIIHNDIDKDELVRISDSIERMMVSVIPVLAAAAGLELIQYGLNEMAGLHEGRFPAVAFQ